MNITELQVVTDGEDNIVGYVMSTGMILCLDCGHQAAGHADFDAHRESAHQ